MKKTARYLMSVDPSLTCSGWALFDVISATILGVGKIKSLSPKVSLGERLSDLQRKIEHVFSSVELNENDVLICEAPTTMKDPHAAIKVEQVRGLFEVVARARSVTVPGRINPRSVQSEVMGLRGRQLARTTVKETAVFVVNQLHGARLKELGVCTELDDLKKNQDIVDAILVGVTGLTWMRSAAHGEQSLEEYFHVPSGSRRLFRSAQ